VAYLSKEDQEYLQETFSSLERPVRLIYFTQQFECEYCEIGQEIFSELADFSEKITLEVFDFKENTSEVEQYGIDMIPGLVVANEKDYGIRYFGIPGGYEFSSLIEAIIDVSKGITGLSDATKQAVKRLEKPIHIQVFITLSCPHCPRAVHMAHQMALESEKVRGDMIEASEFPHLVQRYNVGAVPKVVINDTIEFEGALPEHLYLDHVLQADGSSRNSR
jgi:glutaredoxin-like protein